MHRFTISALVLSFAATLSAQMHRVQRPEGVTRAVGVYEWTGDMLKPENSRFIPVSLYIYGHFEDAGVYMADPVPLAIDTGVRYQVLSAGIVKGTYDIFYGRHLEPVAKVDSHYDEGWFGYGKYALPKAPPPPEKVAIADDDHGKDHKKDDDRPDPERPTFQKEDVKAGKEKPPKDTASVRPVESSPDDDPDRPKLHKHKDPAPSAASAPQVNHGALDDPDRPILHRGRPAASVTGVEVEHLRGLPENLHQAVAVSDEVDRPEHNFAHALSGEERAAVLATLETMARDVLAHPALAAQMANPTATPNNSLMKLAASLQQTAKLPTPSHTASAHGKRTRSATHTKKAASSVSEAVALEDEQVQAFDLAYNATPVYVFSAHTQGEGARLQYVTIVAQPDSFSTLQPILRSLTDATHLDRTPWMRLIDAVDADASNRACLLFELRENGARQFALYRIYAGQPTQVFLTGTTM